MHRFLLTNWDKLNGNVLLVRSPELLHQWTKVLRFKVGEMVVVFDGLGGEWKAAIVSIGAKEIVCNVCEQVVNENELPVKLVLAQSMLKNPEKFEWLVEKGVELGVRHFVPIISQRTERQTLHKRLRLESIIKEAAEQSGRAVLPVLEEETKLVKFLEGVDADSLVLVADFDGKNKISGLAERIRGVKEIILIVGPEGGFTEAEREMFGSFNGNLEVVNLGKRVLRGETAGIVMAVLCGEML